MEMMEVLKSKGIILTSIDRKTGIDVKTLKIYLNFLKAKNYADSRKSYSNNSKDDFSLKSEGKDFLKGWYEFRKKYDIESLERQL